MKFNFSRAMRWLGVCALGMIASTSPALAQEAASTIDSGDTAWLLISAALVMLMTPGLAFFYGGMVRHKNVVSTLLKNYVALALIGVVWVVVGYSLVFSEGNGFIGSLKYLMLDGVGQEGGPATPTVPHIAFMAFQMMFAIITPALIIGALAERISFKGWLLFCTGWSLLVYVPVAHWVWGPDGWLLKQGGLDFAGGLVVHLTAGVSALVAALVLGKRRTLDNTPADIGMVMLGAALLWFGWFGFNAGSAITSGGLAAQAFVTTFISACTAFLAWMGVDWIRTGKPTAIGASIGLVVGLVVVTPAAGFITVTSALIMGAVGGIVCNLVAVGLKKCFVSLDDTLDVFACHGVGGFLGALFTGLLASTAVNGAVAKQGFLIDHSLDLLLTNLQGIGAVAAYAAVATFILTKIVNIITPIRVSDIAEAEGLDASQHGEAFR